MFTLLPISDIHYGSATCDKRKLINDLKAVTDKHMIIGVGDWLDSIITSDLKRYIKVHDDMDGQSILDEQIDGLCNIFRPYAKQIIGIGDGNHEDTILRKCNTNLSKRLCEQLSTPDHTVLYLGYSWLLKIIFRTDTGQGRELIIRGHHGWGGGSRTPGHDLTKYSRDALFWHADLFLYGHTHNLKFDDIEEGRVTGDNSWKTVQKKIIVCGTYQRTYSGNTMATYAERMGFPPATVKSPKVTLRPWMKGVEIGVYH